MQWTVLPRSCSGYHPGEAWLFPDAEHDAQWDQLLGGELRRRQQTTRPSAPQSELQSGLVDLAAPPRRSRAAYVGERKPRCIAALPSFGSGLSSLATAGQIIQLARRLQRKRRSSSDSV